jgi:hypothetical protein
MLFLLIFLSIIEATTCLSSPTAIVPLDAHLSNPGVQEWIDRENHVRIQFKYELNKPSINNFNQLNFSIQDSNTGEHLRNTYASISIPTNEPIFQFDKITVSDGDFDIICPFLKNGEHRVIINIHSENLALALASFNMSVPSSPLSSPTDSKNIT